MIMVECNIYLAIFIVHCLRHFNEKGRTNEAPPYCDHFKDVDQYVNSSITGCNIRVFSEMLVRCPLYFNHGPWITDQNNQISQRAKPLTAAEM